MNGNPMFYGAHAITFKKAKALRSNMTKAEMVLWEHLKHNSLGTKFRRQHPIKNYIVDFYCHSLKIVIEVDGSVHLDKSNKEYDQGRSEVLAEFGLSIYRFTNDDVLYNTENVLKEIREIVSCKKN